MNKCFTPCVFYNEIFNQKVKPSVKLTCDYFDGRELKNISDEERSKCHFKPFSLLRENPINESEVIIGEENVLDS